MSKDKMLTEMWKSPQTFATVLITVFLDRFGTEGLSWDPSTVTMEVEQEFDVDLPQTSFDKLMAAISLLTTDRFYKSLPDFITICNVLSGDVYNPAMFDPADGEEIAWGVTESMLIYPPEEDDPFSDEIRAYIGATLDAEGIINPPDILRIALRSANVSNSIEEFSDDPAMFNAIYDMESSKTGAIEQIVQEKTVMLHDQLAALSLKNGSTEKVLAALKKVM
jgi:hypothetical protein